jgi:hypothetical protein
MTIVLFDCDLCGGPVIMATGPGLKYEYLPGIILDIPADLSVPICQECNETYLTTEEAEIIAIALNNVSIR